ncbi:MAG: hypothetical protein ACLSA2_08335 [Candidatus Gastranaerophilaceae bacterium]
MPFVNLSNDLLCEKKTIRKFLTDLNDNETVSAQIEASYDELSKEVDEYILKYLLNLAKNHNEKNEFIHEISFLTEADTLDKRSDRITLMTLHSAKV